VMTAHTSLLLLALAAVALALPPEKAHISSSETRHLKMQGASLDEGEADDNSSDENVNLIFGFLKKKKTTTGPDPVQEVTRETKCGGTSAPKGTCSNKLAAATLAKSYCSKNRGYQKWGERFWDGQCYRGKPIALFMPCECNTFCACLRSHGVKDMKLEHGNGLMACQGTNPSRECYWPTKSCDGC